MPKAKKIVLTREQQELVTDNINLAYWGADKIRHRPAVQYLRMDYDDCLSLCMEALCRAAVWYDAEKGAYSTAYVMCMNHLLSRRYEESQTKRKIGEMQTVSYDALCKEDAPDESASMIDMIASNQPSVPESVIIHTEAGRIMRALDGQRERDRAIFLVRIVDQRTIRDIAAQYGVSNQAICDKVRAVSEKIRLRIKSEDLISSYKMRRGEKKNEHLHDHRKPDEST